MMHQFNADFPSDLTFPQERMLQAVMLDTQADALVHGTAKVQFLNFSFEAVCTARHAKESWVKHMDCVLRHKDTKRVLLIKSIDYASDAIFSS